MHDTDASLAKLVLVVAGIVVALNFLFLALALYSASLPRAAAAEAVKRAFAEGELVERDYLGPDWRRGQHQYNDCMVLQLAINPRESVVQKALAPAFYVSSMAEPDVCKSLRRMTDGSGGPELIGDSYARYWHGYVPLAAGLLSVTDVGEARQGLRLLVVSALVTLIAAALRAGGAIRIAGISVGVTGLLFWGLPFFGQGLSAAPGDALVMGGLAALVAWRGAFRRLGPLLAFSGAFGALVAFFEFLTGQLPTAACLLFLFTWLIHCRGTEDVRSPWARAAAALAAFAFGALVTVAAKQIAVLALLGPDPARSFVSNLNFYAGLSQGAGFLPGTYVRGFVTLFKHVPMLTYYSIPAGAALLGAFALAWSAAAWLAVRRGDEIRRQYFLVHLVSAMGIAAWVLILPKHAEIHGFMTRMLIVPFSLGWSALALQLLGGRAASATSR